MAGLFTLLQVVKELLIVDLMRGLVYFSDADDPGALVGFRSATMVLAVTDKGLVPFNDLVRPPNMNC